MKEKLIQSIKENEGLRLKPYRDSLGFWTIGYGRNLSQSGISQEEAELMLQCDLDRAVESFCLLPRGIKINCNEVRRDVLIEMIFQLGYNGVLKFKCMMKAICNWDFSLAASEMKDSLWMNQTPVRCEKLAEKMLRGK